MIYLIPVILTLTGIYKDRRWTYQKKIVYMAIIWLSMVLIMGFRYRVGMDTIGYMKSYATARDLSHFWTWRILLDRHEPGYLFACALCKSFTKEFWPLQMIMAAISNGCIFIFLHRYCRNVFIGIAFFLLLQWLYFTAEIMREGVAIGIFLLNFKNLQEKRWLRYYLISLLSVSFHYSAMIIWFIPLARFLKPNLTFIIICIAVLFSTPLIGKIGEVLSIPTITGRIEKYILLSSTYNINWQIGELLKSALPAIIALGAYRISKKRCEFSHLLLLQIFLCAGAFAIPIIFSRFANYSSLFVTVAIANYLTIDIARSWIKTIIIALIIMTQSFYYYSMHISWFPYSSVFNPTEYVEREQKWKAFFY